MHYGKIHGENDWLAVLPVDSRQAWLYKWRGLYTVLYPLVVYTFRHQLFIRSRWCSQFRMISLTTNINLAFVGLHGEVSNKVSSVTIFLAFEWSEPMQRTCCNSTFQVAYPSRRLGRSNCVKYAVHDTQLLHVFSKVVTLICILLFSISSFLDK